MEIIQDGNAKAQKIIGAIAVFIAAVTFFLYWPYVSYIAESPRDSLPQIYSQIFRSPTLDSVKVTDFHEGHGAVRFYVTSKEKSLSLNSTQHFFKIIDPNPDLQVYRQQKLRQWISEVCGEQKRGEWIAEIYYKQPEEIKGRPNLPDPDEGTWICLDKFQKRAFVYSHHGIY